MRLFSLGRSQGKKKQWAGSDHTGMKGKQSIPAPAGRVRMGQCAMQLGAAFPIASQEREKQWITQREVKAWRLPKSYVKKEMFVG